jgi:hypothetical protein
MKKVRVWGPWEDNPYKSIDWKTNTDNVIDEEQVIESSEEHEDEVVDESLQEENKSSDPYSDILKDLK